ncbi:MAG: hypothetical protein JW864_18625 [Spirochaetes bacterium]|nr:hypothetical protein [Spirochaetota bacterium]
MRSKRTNVLQVIIILIALLYIVTGAVFYYSPVKFMEIFSIEVNEDWFKGIQFDTFIAPVYFLARSFSAMIVTAGLAMILPLFDPLRYRGLIYFLGVVFPALASFILLYNGIKTDHWIIILFGLIFSTVLLITICGAILTYKEAKSGIE